MSDKVKILLAGLITGAIAIALVALGNPANMGFCIACFLRDIAGGVKLHSAAVVQYIRPEIVGLVIGAFVVALMRREFSPRGGSSPATRFVLGMVVMVGALMFLGCPLRMVLRMAGGDLNAWIGLVGFILGIGVGILFLNRGFSLGRTHAQSKLEGASMPAIAVFFLVLLVAVPSVLAFSESGPGSMRAPIVVALIAGLVVGAVAQLTRMCTMGGIRDVFLFRDTTLISGFAAIFVAALIGNLIMGKFNLSMEGQPVAHTEVLWNILGMFVVGWGSVFLGGCPLRQLILAGEGNSDSTITVLGLIVGAAFCHNFGLASSADGTTAAGQIAVVVCIAILLVIGLCNIRKNKA